MKSVWLIGEKNVCTVQGYHVYRVGCGLWRTPPPDSQTQEWESL